MARRWSNIGKVFRGHSYRFLARDKKNPIGLLENRRGHRPDATLCADQLWVKIDRVAPEGSNPKSSFSEEGRAGQALSPEIRLPINALRADSTEGASSDSTRRFSSTPATSRGILQGATGIWAWLLVLPGRAEWILKRNCLTRLKGSSTKTFPIRSASTAQGGMSC